jgi:protein tyrosine phosphatase
MLTNYNFTKNQLDYYIKSNSKSDWLNEFNMINQHQITKLKKKGKLNNDKNRYCNILPYDDNIVTLPHNKYINASWIPCLNPGTVTNQYIATQGPLPNTIEDFWEMIWVTNTTTIIMLTPLTEKEIVKCECYWLSKDYKNKYILNDYKDENDYLVMTNEILITKDIIKREFLYHRGEEQRKITQFHYINWLDFDCPDIKSFIEFVNCITNNKYQQYPLCIHCSAGVGRTGVLITVLMILNNINNNKINIAETIIHLRKYRMGMVQTKEQLEFCYKVINQMI